MYSNTILTTDTVHSHGGREREIVCVDNNTRMCIVLNRIAWTRHSDRCEQNNGQRWKRNVKGMYGLYQRRSNIFSSKNLIHLQWEIAVDLHFSSAQRKSARNRERKNKEYRLRERDRVDGDDFFVVVIFWKILPLDSTAGPVNIDIDRRVGIAACVYKVCCVLLFTGNVKQCAHIPRMSARTQAALRQFLSFNLSVY